MLNINSESEPIRSTPAQPSASNPATAEAAAVSNKSKKDFSIDTEINSVKELKEKAPEVHKRMMIGIAFTIVKEMRKHAQELKKMMREGRQ